MKDIRERVVLLHHNDRDGIVAASIVINNIQCDTVDIDVISTDYSTSFQDKLNGKEYDSYIIVDLSITNNTNASFLSQLYESDKRVLWIDHHVSSISFMNDNPQYDLKLIDGMRIIGLSGAALTWLWFHTSCYRLHDYSDTYYVFGYGEAIELLREMHCPYYVIMTHRYDIFDLDDDVIAFSYGYNPEYPYEVNNEFHECITCIDCGKCTPDGTCDILKPYIINGGYIKRYQDSKDNTTANEIGFDISIEVHSGDDVITYTGFAMNRVFGNTFAFGDRMNKYTICIPFYFNGKNFTYSMYTKVDNIDCSVLCEALGGGGHAKAAGFTSDKFLFGDGNRTVIINL